MTVFETRLNSLDGRPLDLRAHVRSGALIVNVASFCGFTPQYAELETLASRYRTDGFAVIGVPCNQFGAQEPGSPDEIAEFCTANYGVSFPLAEKLDVNGEHRHPLYRVLCEQEDADGEAGDVQWNFEKFIVNRDGNPVARFRPAVPPDAPGLIAAVESTLR